MPLAGATSVRVMERRRLVEYSQRGSQLIPQNRPKRVQNGVYISGLSLLNTYVRLRPTGSAKSQLPTTFLAHEKSRLEQWL